MALRIFKIASAIFLLLLSPASSARFELLSYDEVDRLNNAFQGFLTLLGILILILLAVLFFGWVAKVADKEASLLPLIVVPGGIGLLIVSNANRLGPLIVGWVLVAGVVLGLYMRLASTGSSQVPKSPKPERISARDLEAYDFPNASIHTNATPPESARQEAETTWKAADAARLQEAWKVAELARPEAMRKASEVAKVREESKAAEIAGLQAAWAATRGAPHAVEQITRLNIERENLARSQAALQATSQVAPKNVEIENTEVVRPITTARAPYCPTCNSYNDSLGHRLNCMYCGNPLPAAPINQSDVPCRSIPYKSDKAM